MIMINERSMFMADQAKKAQVTNSIEDLRKALADSPIVKIDMEGYKELSIDTSLLDDVDAFALISDVQETENVQSMIELLILLMGKDEYAALKAHYVAKEGRLRFSTLFGVYTQLFDALDPKV